MVDFAKPTGPNGTHPLLFQWVIHYFKTGRPSLMDDCQLVNKMPSDMNKTDTPLKLIELTENATASSKSLDASENCDKDYPPLYLQHEGLNLISNVQYTNVSSFFVLFRA